MQMFRSMSHARGTLVTAIALLCTAGAVLAQTPPAQTQSDRPAPTKDQREKMAQAHDQMAACLRSDKAIEQCHQEFMKSGGMMMHDHMYRQHSGSPPTQQ